MANCWHCSQDSDRSSAHSPPSASLIPLFPPLLVHPSTGPPPLSHPSNPSRLIDTWKVAEDGAGGDVPRSGTLRAGEQLVTSAERPTKGSWKRAIVLPPSLLPLVLSLSPSLSPPSVSPTPSHPPRSLSFILPYSCLSLPASDVPSFSEELALLSEAVIQAPVCLWIVCFILEERMREHVCLSKEKERRQKGKGEKLERKACSTTAKQKPILCLQNKLPLVIWFIYLHLYWETAQCPCVWSPYMENYQLYWYPWAHSTVKSCLLRGPIVPVQWH